MIFDNRPRIGDFWRHDTMPEKVEVVGTCWSDGIRWVEVIGASGVKRYWQEWEWYLWAKNATRLVPRMIRKGER